MRLHLIDGTYELFRAHYSKRPSATARDGQDVKGTVGVMASLLGLLADPDEQVTHLAVAYDNPIESFRNDMFDGYKTGAGMDPALVAQMDLVEQATAALGITVWSMDRWEADDALASAARRWRDDVDQVRILTPDKDLGQSVRGQQVVQVDRVRRRVFDEAGVLERNGVSPASIPDWLALVGDTADGIPGLPGFGAKTAATLLAHYGDVDAIPDAAADWVVKVRGAARLADTLAANREAVRLYRELARLVEDVPLAESLADLRWRGAPRAQFEDMCRRLNTSRLQVTQWRT